MIGERLPIEPSFSRYYKAGDLSNIKNEPPKRTLEQKEECFNSFLEGICRAGGTMINNCSAKELAIFKLKYWKKLFKENHPKAKEVFEEFGISIDEVEKKFNV